MPLITNLTSTTELEAVNKMLAAIGQAPITDLAAGQAQTDVAMATTALRDAARGVQTLPWQFNTKFQVPLSPAASAFAWTDPDGTAVSLNIFTPPTNLASFTPSQTSAQQFSGYPLDLAIMPSVSYVPGTMVFYDRRFNRDGLIASTFSKLYIDATYYFNFEQLPETARQYITVLAGRRFIEQVLGAQELVGFQHQDELIALRSLKRDQGDEDTFNMLNHPDVFRVLGFRPRMTGNFVDYRRGR
jgi:hypothetical protein